MGRKKKKRAVSWTASRFSLPKHLSKWPDLANIQSMVSRPKSTTEAMEVVNTRDDDRGGFGLKLGKTKEYAEAEGQKAVPYVQNKQRRTSYNLTGDEPCAQSIQSTSHSPKPSKQKLKNAVAIRTKSAIDTARDIPSNVFNAKSIKKPSYEPGLSVNTTLRMNKTHPTTSNSSVDPLPKATRNMQELGPDISSCQSSLFSKKKAGGHKRKQSLQPVDAVMISTPTPSQAMSILTSSSPKSRSLDHRRRAAFERIKRVYGQEFAERHLNADSIRTYSSSIAEESCIIKESDQSDVKSKSRKAHVESVGNGWDAVLAEARRQAERLENREREQSKTLSSEDLNRHKHSKGTDNENESLSETVAEKCVNGKELEQIRESGTILKMRSNVESGKSRKRQRDSSGNEALVENGYGRKASKTPKAEHPDITAPSFKHSTAAMRKNLSKRKKRRRADRENTDRSENSPYAFPKDPATCKMTRAPKHESNNPEIDLLEGDEDIRRSMTSSRSANRHSTTDHQSDSMGTDEHKGDRNRSSTASAAPSYALSKAQSDTSNDSGPLHYSVAHQASLSSLRSLIPERFFTTALQQLNLTEHQRVSAMVFKERKAEKKRLKRHKGPVKPRPIRQDIDENTVIESGLIEGAQAYERNDPEVIIRAAVELIGFISRRRVGEAARSPADQHVEDGGDEGGSAMELELSRLVMRGREEVDRLKEQIKELQAEIQRSKDRETGQSG